ncbi:Chlorophyllase [Sesbania bispinosa]|nr:Chlorophyllase [Sesbania bispinosa]
MAQIGQPVLATTTTDVFQNGDIQWKKFNVDTPCPKPLLVFSPTVAGKYPVIVFHHGFCVQNSFYSQLLGHITSHGFIVVAPQLFSMGLPMLGQLEVEFAGKVVNWIAEGLQAELDENIEESVQAKLDTLVLSGHSKGGKTAFAVALGYTETNLNFSALIGIDPVAGPSRCKMCRTLPHILTDEPESFNLNIPVAEFYNECKPPRVHFVTTDYGHMDMLDDDTPGIMGNMMKCMCKNGTGPKDFMRRTVGGLVVAFLRAYLNDQWKDLNAILADPSIAPAKLDPVEYLPA